jgi:diguanylate cyclase (GGDEF)-like protein/PAS domain S-box-containing protein
MTSPTSASPSPDAGTAGRGNDAVLDLSRSEVVASKEIVQLFFAEAPIGLCVITPDLNVAQVNRALCEFGGVTSDDLVDRDVTNVLRTYLAPADFARILPLTTEVIAGTRDDLQMDATFTRRDGEARNGRLSAWVVRNDDTTIKFIVVTIENTTAVIDRQAALAAREQRFEAMVQHSSDVVVVLDATGRAQYVSPAIENVLGYTPEQALEIAPREIIHPDDMDEWAAYFRRCVNREPSPAHISVRLRSANGTWHFVDLTAFNLLDESAVHGIVVNYHDETDRVLAGAELRRREERFRALVEDSSDIVALVDEAGLISWVSPAIEHVLGHAPSEVLGTGGASILHPEDVTRVRTALTTVMQSPRGERRETVRMRHRDGSWHWMEAALTNRLNDPVVGAVVVHVNDVSDRRAFELQLREHAVRDDLTKLANRTLLLERIAWANRVIRARQPADPQYCAVIGLDLDRFKVVNEAHNHQSGDELLQAVAERLVSIANPTTTVARLGGDEFALCLGAVDDELEVLELAETILAAMREPFTISGSPIFITASVGIAFGDPVADPDSSPDAVLRDVDTAMYIAKSRGGDQFEVFEQESRARVLARLDTEHALRRAIDENEFRLYYQPVIDLDTGYIVAAEALIRWQHPERGLVPPIEFIPIAEESGLILKIGEWVLYEAARQRAQWATTDPHGHFTTVWVNVSAKQLDRPNFVGLVQDALETAGLAPGELGLEITETVLMSDSHADGSNVSDLVAARFPLAIDDFGTGYSSLTYLRRFHVDVVKLDRSFVDGLGTNADDTAIVSAVVHLGHSLGIRVSAEGIETNEQLVALRALACDTACGYLLARPLPADEVTALIAAGTPLA